MDFYPISISTQADEIHSKSDRMLYVIWVSIHQPFSYRMFKVFPKRQIVDSSKMKAFADDNFKFDENGRKFFKWVEKTMGKGEIARYEQFLLFLQCFQKKKKNLVLQTRKTKGLFGKRLILFS